MGIEALKISVILLRPNCDLLKGVFDFRLVGCLYKKLDIWSLWKMLSDWGFVVRSERMESKMMRKHLTATTRFQNNSLHLRLYKAKIKASRQLQMQNSIKKALEEASLPIPIIVIDNDLYHILL
uniref:Uncharacterized protein n=1 Tax=Lactuca sativa TaxID=4236 RepID=A0A9R1XGV2_LACSA|nr:hypothetical protein LSAT_V11C400165100 [Lactuca sativa]